jgi:hypothetical protein
MAKRYGALVNAGYNNSELSDLRAERADRGADAQELDNAFGEPEAFESHPDGRRAYNYLRALVYRDESERSYQLDKPSLPLVSSGQARIALNDVIELHYRIGRSANRLLRLDAPGAVRVTPPEPGEVLTLERTKRGEAERALRNMRVVVDRLLTDPQRSAGLIQVTVIDIV